MIPRVITTKHVEEAIAAASRRGVPSHRESILWDLVHDGRPYPPKYIITLAYRLATGDILDPVLFDSGEARSRLRALGFTVEPKGQ